MPGRSARKTAPSPPSLLAKLERMHPGARTEIDFSGPLELLVATILSAQSTDRQVNLVTKELFKKYRTAADYAAAKTEELERDIHSTGFFRAKSRLIQGAARMLQDDFGGEVPRTMEELTRLPGVARKTANIVLTGAFGIVEGMAVDTHVGRVSRRLGLSKCEDPAKIEQDLLRFFPKESWARATSLLVFHGRYLCKAKKPECGRCLLKRECPSSCV
ncbi:MAG: endonuclease III [Euryarchaeota archaeon]|nr:endonuclease III [Euryarchaeota archaeon]